MFKDKKSTEPRYEIFITPEHLAPDTFKPFKKVRVYTTMGTEAHRAIPEPEEEEETETVIAESDVLIENFLMVKSPLGNLTQITSYTDTELSDHKLFHILLKLGDQNLIVLVDTAQSTLLTKQ